MNEKFQKARQEYEEIKCSDALKERIENKMKKSSRNIITGISSGAVAGVILCTGVLNAFPQISVAAQNVPVVKNIVNVLTIGRFTAENNGYSADISTPQITGLDNKELEEKLNSEFKSSADLIKQQYNEDVSELQKEFGDDIIHMNVNMDYQVLTNNDDYLCLDVYLFTASGSSSTKHSYYNIDKNTNTLISLEDIYKDKPNYKQELKEYILAEMERRNKEEDGIYFLPGDEFGTESEKALDNMSKFYINDKGNVVICFDKYEIAAGAQGCPEFEIID